MKKNIFHLIFITTLILIINKFVFTSFVEAEDNIIKINYISEETNTVVTLEASPDDIEIGAGRVWISSFEEIQGRNSNFVAPMNKTFIGWEYESSIVGDASVTNTLAYSKGEHFTQDEYYSLSANETEINLSAVWGYTVYVDGVNGSDDADGISNPVRTMGRAYEVLAKLDSGNPNANITGFTVSGNSTTGYTYLAEDTTNFEKDFNGRIVVKNNINYKNQNEGKYLYITYGDLINSANYNASTGTTTYNDGVSTKNFTGINTATGYAITDPVKLSKSGTTYKVVSKTASGSYHFLLQKKLNQYSYELNGSTYYTYGRLSQYTENLRAHVGKGLMTPENDGLILITSYDGVTQYDAILEFGDFTRYASGGDLIYKNIKLSFFQDSSIDKESLTYVGGYAGNGNYLVFDENVTTIKDSKHSYPPIYGGSHNYRWNSNAYSGVNGNKLGNSGTSALNKSRITIKSGTWYAAYSGSYQQKVGQAVTTYGKEENNAAVINVYGGTYSNGIGMGHEGASANNSYVYVYGGTFSTIHGSGLGSTGSMADKGITNVLITGETTRVTGSVFGGSTNGSHVGDINVVIKNGTINATVYGGSSARPVTGNIEITVKGGNMKSIIGGCATGSVEGTVKVNISGGKIVGDIYTSGQGGTQNDPSQYHTGGTQGNTTGSQILDKNDPRLSILITGDKAVDSPAIIDAASKVNSAAGQHHTDKKLIINGVEYFYPQLYSKNYEKLLPGYTRGTYTNHGVTQYTITSRTSFLSLATVKGVELNITGGEIQGNIFGGGKVSVVEGNVLINIANATIKGNIYGGGDGSYEPTVDLYIPTSATTTTTQTFTWKGSDTFNIEEYDEVHNLPIDFEKRYIYSPTYDYMGGVNGDVTIFINNNATIVGNVYGGGNEGLVTGNVFLNIEDVAVSKAIYGGGNVGHVSSNTQLNLKNVTTPNLYGGGYSGRVEGSTTLKLTNNQINEVFGGGYAGNIEGNSTVTINSGYYTNVFAGCDKAVVLGNTNVNVGNEEELAIIISGVLYGGGRGVDHNADGDASDFCTVEGSSDVIITGLNTRVENYGSIKLGTVLGNVNVTFKDYWTGNATNKYKVMNGIDRATNVYFDNAFVLLENKDENGNLLGIKDITNLYIPDGSGLKISATGEIAGDFHGGGTFYLDSEVCLNIRGDIFGKSLIILNPMIMEEGHLIKGSENYPYMRIYGNDDSNGTALYSDDEKYTIVNGRESSGASIYYIEFDVLINESITTNIINTEGKHYADDATSWSNEDFYLINSGIFSSNCEVTIGFLDDGKIGNLYKNVTRRLVMYTGDDKVILPTGTNIIMVYNSETYKYRIPAPISEIDLSGFTKMNEPSENYSEITDIRENAILVGGNEMKKSYSYNENFRFIIDFSEAREEELLGSGPYTLTLEFYDFDVPAETFQKSKNTVRIEPPRQYNLEYSLDREWYESDNIITIGLNMTSDYYVLYDSEDANKSLMAMITIKDENGEFIELPHNMIMYIDNIQMPHTNGNMTYKVFEEITQERMEKQEVFKIDMSQLLMNEMIAPGNKTISISYYKALNEVLEEKIVEYNIPLEIVCFKQYSLKGKVKVENDKTEKELLTIDKAEDNSRTIQMEYIGDLIEPYVEILLQKESSYSYNNIVNSVTIRKYSIENNLKEIEAVFGSTISTGNYKIIFNLYDKYGGLKASEAFIFYCK